MAAPYPEQARTLFASHGDHRLGVKEHSYDHAHDNHRATISASGVCAR
ncbi:hypothetical protein ABIB58_000537 [Brevundimonas sp. UYEF29]|jgi:hypothetical protein